MKKVVLFLGIMFVILLAVLFVCVVFIPLCNIGASQVNEPETLLFCSQGPNGEYTLEAYRTQPGATVDYSIKVYLVEEDERSLIYNAYHEYQAEIDWVDASVVIINGKRIDLSIGEKYDWRINT